MGGSFFRELDHLPSKSSVDTMGTKSIASRSVVSEVTVSSTTTSKFSKGRTAAAPGRCSVKACCSQHGKVIRKAPSVVWMPIIVFTILTGAGLAVIFMAANSDRVIAEKDAISQAKETGRWFSTQLDKAMAPIFSLAQFMREIEEFQHLPALVGPAYDSGSLPFRPEPTQEGIPIFRDVSGSSLEDPQVVERFNRIASEIKEQANMKAVLVNLQVVPHGVISLAYPLNNTDPDDFPPGKYLDSSTVIGYDLLTSPLRKAGAEAAIRSKEMVVIGPISLQQCSSSDNNGCDPIVKQAFIARLNVPSKTHTIALSDGTKHRSWGFAAGIINWYALVQQSQVYDDFADEGLEFRLTKVQLRCGAAGEACTEEEIELAKTPGFDGMGGGWITVSVSLETTINQWTMTVGYQDPAASWLPGAISAVALASFCIGVLVYFILYQKQIQAEMAKEKMSIQKKIRSLERKKHEMESKLKSAYDVIHQRQIDESKVGIVSNLRKIGRLEEEMKGVDQDIEDLEQYVHDLAVASKQSRSGALPREIVQIASPFEDEEILQQQQPSSSSSMIQV